MSDFPRDDEKSDFIEYLFNKESDSESLSSNSV